MLLPRALRSWLCVLSCAWLRAGAASRLKSPALPIQSEREPLPFKGLSGETHGDQHNRMGSLFPRTAPNVSCRTVLTGAEVRTLSKMRHFQGAQFCALMGLM